MKHRLDWYRHDPVAFIRGVHGIGEGVIGAYIILIDLIYSNGGDARRDDRYLSGILGCSMRKATALTERLISIGMIVCVNGKLSPVDASFVLPPGREPISADLRQFIIDRDGLNCRWCALLADPLHIDHIIAVANGGSNDPENLCVSCRRCNLSKGAKYVAEWVP